MGTEAIDSITPKAFPAIFNKPIFLNKDNEYWYEEDIDHDLKWSFSLKRCVLFFY